MGFLPPGGTGYLSFLISPTAGLATGTQITDQASIVFDKLAPLATAPWTNTIGTLVPPSEVAATASGLAYSRVSQTFNGTVTLTNMGTSPVNGPFQILFASLTAGVTLANGTGNLSGVAYVTVPTVTSLAAAQSVTVAVQFKNPLFGKINFTPQIYSGSI